MNLSIVKMLFLMSALLVTSKPAKNTQKNPEAKSREVTKSKKIDSILMSEDLEQTEYNVLWGPSTLIADHVEDEEQSIGSVLKQSTLSEEEYPPNHIQSILALKDDPESLSEALDRQIVQEDPQ